MKTNRLNRSDYASFDDYLLALREVETPAPPVPVAILDIVALYRMYQRRGSEMSRLETEMQTILNAVHAFRSSVAAERFTVTVQGIPYAIDNSGDILSITEVENS